MKKDTGLYFYDSSDCTYKRHDHANRDEMDGAPIANFIAEITKETRYIDGRSHVSMLTIRGRRNGRELPELTIPASEFPGMSWILPHWGVQCCVRAGSGAKDDLRAAIQLASDAVDVTNVFRHSGWTSEKDDGDPAYLSTSGAITKDGLDTSQTVELPHELRYIALQDPNRVTPEAINALIRTAYLGPLKICAALLASSIRATFGGSDYALHITGRSGTFKSEIASIYQSAFGPESTARNLPGSWSSTANALEALAFYAKDAIMVIDDFIPVGGSWQLRAYQQKADQIIRGAGNQAGRQRLNDTSHLQETMYPRGLILSTGEDTPEGMSLRARLFMFELAKGDINTNTLTRAQQDRMLTSIAMSHFIMWQARNRRQVKEVVEQTRLRKRAELVGIGHARTPGMVADMIAALTVYSAYLADTKHWPAEDIACFFEQTSNAILDAANTQAAYITESDPAELFVAALMMILSAKHGHFATIAGGIPQEASHLGWIEDRSGQMIAYKPGGARLGWVDIVDRVLYLNADTGYEDIKKRTGQLLTLTKATMWKRLSEAGLLDRIDHTRGRNTIRITAEKLTKNALALRLDAILTQNEADETETEF